MDDTCIIQLSTQYSVVLVQCIRYSNRSLPMHIVPGFHFQKYPEDIDSLRIQHSVLCIRIEIVRYYSNSIRIQNVLHALVLRIRICILYSNST